jgi:hypothetical protein
MKMEVRRGLGEALACMALLPLTVFGSSQIKAEALIARGDPCAGKGDYDKAIAEYTEDLRLEPKNATFHSFRAKAHRALGHETGAANDDRKAEELKK